MKTLLLHVFSAAGTTTPLAPRDVKDFAKSLEASVGLASREPLTASRADEPFEASFVLDPNRVPEDEVAVEALRAAFNDVGVTSGVYEVSLSEHDEDDTDFEAPPWFEQTVTLGASTPAAAATVSLDLYTACEHERWGAGPEPVTTLVGQPLSEASRRALDTTLRSLVNHPIEFIVAIQPGLTQNSGIRVALKPLPVGQLPSLEALKAVVTQACAAVGVPLVKARIGAYRGSWDDTVFVDEFELGADAKQAVDAAPPVTAVTKARPAKKAKPVKKAKSVKKAKPAKKAKSVKK